MDNSISSTGFTIALAGQPNTGKSTLFNKLTGSKQHVGNWPGKTVEQKSGKLIHLDKTYKIVDLPGTYSLTANSAEELIARDFIISDEVDALIVMIDTSQLERSMYLLSEIAGINIPVVAVFNMLDVAEQKGRKIDIKMLENKLHIPIVPMVAAKGKGLEELFSKLTKIKIKSDKFNSKELFIKYEEVFGESYKILLNSLKDMKYKKYSKEWLVAKLLEDDGNIKEIVRKNISEENWSNIEKVIKSNEDGAILSANCKYAWIQEITQKSVKYINNSRLELSKFDKIATHKTWGKPLAILIMALSLVVMFMFSAPFASLIGSLIVIVNNGVKSLLNYVGASNLLISLFTEGLIPPALFSMIMVTFVAGTVLIFGFLEDIGYMARVAYVFDNSMNKVGLHGKSIMPFITGFGCNISGITGARVIESWQQRFLTMITCLVVPCVATWGVVGFVSSLFFANKGIFIVIGLLVFSVVHVWVTSLFFRKKHLNTDNSTGLIMELPPYHKPDWKNIFTYVWIKVKQTLKKAVVIIVSVSIVMWVFSYSQDGNIEHSLIYKIRPYIEPIGMFFGLEWRLFLAFLASTLGKEAALGVISMLFGVGKGITSFSGLFVHDALSYSLSDLSSVMVSSVSSASALAFIVAFYFNIPCMASVISLKTEMNSKKWTRRVVIYYVGTALIMSSIVYHIAKFII